MIKKLLAIAIAMSLMFGASGVAEAANVYLYGSDSMASIDGVIFHSTTTGAKTNTGSVGTGSIQTGANFEVKSGTFDMVFGGCIGSGTGDVTSNIVSISGGEVTVNVYGGASASGNATGNEVNIGGGTVSGSIYAGYSNSGNATGNEVNIDGGTVSGSIYAGSATHGIAEGNIVTMTGGTVAIIQAGNGGVAAGNTTNISGGEVTSFVSGGFSMNGNVTGNTVNISGGTTARACAGYSNSANASTNNTVNISGGEVTAYVYGGASTNGNATGNQVNIGGGTVSGDVYGGFSANGSTMTDNKVNISGKADLTRATLHGYKDGTTDHTGNTLNVDATWKGTVKCIKNFDTIVNDGDLTATEGVSATGTDNTTFINNNRYQGNLSTSATLNFINNGPWYPDFSSGDTSNNSATAITLRENGIINLNDRNWDGEYSRHSRTLEITADNFSSYGGTFVINTDLANDTGDVIDMSGLTTVTGNARVQVAYDPSFKTGATITGNHKFLLLPSTYTEGSFKITSLGTSYNGVLYSPILNGWQIAGIKAEADETSKAVSDTANVMNFAWLETVNNLQKRLGDLRGGEASDMAWARFQRNNDDYDGARKFNVSGNMYQVGYDFALKNQVASRGYFGVSLEAFDGTQSYEIGGGDVKSMSLGAYYTKIYDSGHYFDFILRYGRLDNDSTSYDSSLSTPTLTKLDYAMNSITLSGEYGYRANLGKSGLYLEPQAEFIYGYLSGAKATSSTNILADIDSTNHFVTRLGLAFGQRVKNFNYYLRGSYYHDFTGTTNVKYGDASYKQDSAQNWWEISLGGGWNISKVSYFYAELIKHFKDVSNSLNFNLGFRFTL